MIFVKPDNTYRLTNEYGGLFWSYQDRQLYGIDAYGDRSRRWMRLLTDQTEEIHQVLYITGAIPDESITLSAEFWSGQVGILMEYFRAQGGKTDIYSTINWYDWGSERLKANGAYNILYRGTASFTLRHEPNGLEEVRTIFHPEQATGGIARWNGAWTNNSQTPESMSQILSWVGKYGTALAMTIDDGFGGSLSDPSKYLVIAGIGGAFRWMDVTSWSDNNQIMTPYKELGVIGCREIRDITIDRENNVLWILDGGKKLHQVNLEPFGIEAENYTNTPKGLVMTPELREVEPEQEMIIQAQLLDMWGQPVQEENKEVQWVSSGLGEFEDGGDKWAITVTTNTDSEGIARVVYRGSEINS